MTNTTGAGDIQLPSLELIAGIIPATTGVGAITLPALQLSGSADGIVLPALTLAATGLTGTVTAPFPFTATIVLPSLSLAATAMEVTAGVGDITLPALTLQAYDGNYGAIRLPSLTLAATGLTGNVGAGNLSLPTLTVAGAGHTSTSGAAAITLPRLIIAGAGLVGTTGALRPQLLRLALAAHGVSGTIGSATLTLPMLTVDAAGHTSTVGEAAIELPMLLLAATGLASVAAAVNGALSALVLETESTRLTTYSNFNFNSLTEFNGVFLGANADGIYALSGDTDDLAEIASTVRFGIPDFKEQRLKRLTAAYVGYRADGEMTLTVTTDEDNEYQYTLAPRHLDNLHPSRVKLGKGAKGRYFQLALQNRDGTNFELDQLALDADVLSRRLG